MKSVSCLCLFIVGVTASRLALCPQLLESELRHPTHLVAIPGQVDDFLVSEQSGRLLRLRAGQRALVLDLGPKMLTSDRPREQRGFHSFVLDLLTRRLYVCYSGNSEDQQYDHALIAARYNVEVYPEHVIEVDESSERRLLTIGQPDPSRNGGFIFLDPADHAILYVTVGSGGGPTEEQDRFNLSSLLGKVLRLNVSNPDGPYSIPRGNPFTANPAQVRPEIFASGFWNPWRCTADREGKTDEVGATRVICGDVGAGQRNEDSVLLLSPGGFYDCKTHCKQQQGSAMVPLYVHRHERGQALIGGPVYRGTAIRELQGTYLFGDFVHGSLHALVEIAEGDWTKVDIALLPDKKPLGDFFILSLVADSQGEPLMLSATNLNSSVPSGSLYRLLPKCDGPSATSSFWPLILCPLLTMIRSWRHLVNTFG